MPRLRLFRRALLTTAALVAAVVLWAAVTLPPAAIRPSLPRDPLRPTGAFHVHTNRSDGAGSIDDLAAAAARAGLQFVVFADHGDGTRAPEPPAYRHGVLCIDAVEVSTASGHVTALGLDGPAPYPLAGEARDVIEDIHRLGGRGVASHLDSPRPELAWTTGVGELDGIEWLNLDSEWRRHGGPALAAAGLRLLLRPAETLTSLLGDAASALSTWDDMLAARPVFGVAAVDAHTRLPRPRDVFRTVSQTVLLDRPLTGDAAADARIVVGALIEGRSFSVVRGYIDAPDALSFTATAAGGARALPGGRIADPSGGVRLVAAVPAGIDAPLELAIVSDGRIVARGQASIDAVVTEARPYRVHVRINGRPAPWIVSNPIYVGPLSAAAPQRPVEIEAPDSSSVRHGRWGIESDPRSTGTVVSQTGGTTFTFALASGAPAGQYVAMAADVPAGSRLSAVELVASASRPMRVSLQLRTGDGDAARRWRRSIYLDTKQRRVVVPLGDMVDADRSAGAPPPDASMRSVLLVVDTLNTPPGAGGEVHVAILGLRSAR